MTKIPDIVEAWGGPVTLVFSENGRAFFTERLTGSVWEILGGKNFRLIKHLPIVQVTGHHDAGLLGLTLDPGFEKNDRMYAYYTEGTGIEHAKNRVVSFKTDGSELKTVLSGIPGGRIHDGGILKFGPDGKLYIGVGVDNDNMKKSQDLGYLGGKILRVNPDGTIPDDNPLKDSPVYSWGHRNVFGLAFHPKTKKLYISDVGPEKDDEINIVEAGKNYGWPKVTGAAKDPKFEDPIITYTPTITPTQNLFFENDLYFGAYNEGSVHRLKLTEDGKGVAKDEVVYTGQPFGVVGVFVSPDGEFYITTKDKILKIEIVPHLKS